MTAPTSDRGAGAESGGPSPAPGGPPGWVAVLAIGGIVLGALLIVLQVVGIGVVGPAASPTIPPTGQAAQRTWDEVAAALTAQGFQVHEPVTPYRPGESPSLVGVPRRLLQVTLPGEPQGGYVVVYELPTNGDADRVGRDFAAYLASGTGAVQYPRDARFVLQRVGQTLVFFPWSPQVDTDPRAAQVAAILGTVGVPVTP